MAANAASPLVNTATATGGGDPTVRSDDDSTVVGTGPVLAIDKSHSGNFTQGQNGSYTLAVSNAGSVATSGEITVTDTLPTGLSYVSATGTGWVCGAVAQLVTCTSSTVIAATSAGNPITLTVAVAANAASPLVNTATATGGGDPTVRSDDDSTVVNDPIPPVAIPTLTELGLLLMSLFLLALARRRMSQGR